jgi:phosphoserine phosphatase
MLETAGWAIGFDPKPSVEPACAVVVDSMGELEDVLATAGVFDGTYDPA